METDRLTKEKPKDFDDLLTQLGTGRWNIFIFIVSSLSAMRIPAQVLSGAFVAPSLKYTCVPPSSAFSNNSMISSSTDAPLDQCHYWDQEHGVMEDCTQWEFDTSTFTSTLTSDFNLVCSRGSLRSVYSSIYMFGAMFGSLLAGHWADLKGRKFTMTISFVTTSVIPLVLSWSPSLVFILMCRFLEGIVHPMIFTSLFTISVEIAEPRYRATVAILTILPWALGTMAWGGLAYLVRSWRWLNFIASVPSILFIACIWCIDESPRWLIVHGRHDDALKIIRKAAKLNKTILADDEELKQMMAVTTESVSNNTASTKGERNPLKKYVKDVSLLFSTPEMRLRTYTMLVLFFVGSMVFYGLNLSGVSLTDNPFLYMAIGGLVEVPGYTINAPIIDKWGRKMPTVAGYLICGFAILALTFIPKDASWMVMLLAMSGKCTITMAYQIIYMYILELLPTEVRLQGLGASMFAARTGSLLSPFIVDNLAESVRWLPSVIFGSLSILAGLATLRLPETNKKHLIETIEELSTGRRNLPDVNMTVIKKDNNTDDVTQIDSVEIDCKQSDQSGNHNC